MKRQTSGTGKKVNTGRQKRNGVPAGRSRKASRVKTSSTSSSKRPKIKRKPVSNRVVRKVPSPKNSSNPGLKGAKIAGEYSDHFSEKGLWSKIGKYSQKIGRALLRQILALYYCLIDKETPKWAKTVIVGALGYLIFPADAIPDIIPVFGFSDDAAVVTAAIASIGMALNKDHWGLADKKLAEWFD